LIDAVYPDEAELLYTYDGAGQLQNVARKEYAATTTSPVITNIECAPTGAVSKIQYANGITTTKTYKVHEQYRLDRIFTNGPQSTTTPRIIQDLPYAFDPNGNITKIVDASQTSSAKTMNYAYVRDNPLKLTDNSGKCIEDLCIGETIATVSLLAIYAPEITSYAESLTTNWGVIGTSQAIDDAKNGHYGWAAVGFLTTVKYLNLQVDIYQHLMVVSKIVAQPMQFNMPLK
jgi:hypothetical protein